MDGRAAAEMRKARRLDAPRLTMNSYGITSLFSTARSPLPSSRQLFRLRGRSSLDGISARPQLGRNRPQNHGKTGETNRKNERTVMGLICVLTCGKNALTRGAGEGNRTLITSLEGWSSTIELHPRGPSIASASSAQRNGSDARKPEAESKR